MEETMKLRILLATLCSVAVVIVGLTPVTADESEPYGNKVTERIADRLKGKQRGGWLAVTLNIGGYHGKRHAEIVKIPRGHGKRWVGIIHVPAGKGWKAQRALSDVWVARHGNRFVVPLKTKYNTDGCAAKPCRKASAWAARRLGKGWTVR